MMIWSTLNMVLADCVASLIPICRVAIKSMTPSLVMSRTPPFTISTPMLAAECFIPFKMSPLSALWLFSSLYSSECAL